MKNKKLLFFAVCFVFVFSITNNVVFAKKFELGNEEIGRIDAALGLLKTFGNTVLPESSLKTVLNTVLSTGETSVDVTYGLLVLSAVDELEFIDMVTSQGYKEQSAEYFNSILDRRLSLIGYYKGLGSDIPRVMSGRITSPVGALTLNTFQITGDTMEIMVALQNLRKVLLYDGLWRYFDSRRYNESHEVAWEDAKFEMGMNIESPYSVRRLDKNNLSIEIQFSTLWDKWGPYTTTAGVKPEAKEQFTQEMRGLVMEAVTTQALAEKNAKPSLVGKIRSGLANMFAALGDKAWSTSSKAWNAVTSLIVQLRKEDTGAGISLVNELEGNQDSVKQPKPVNNLTPLSFTNEEDIQAQDTDREEVLTEEVKEIKVNSKKVEENPKQEIKQEPAQKIENLPDLKKESVDNLAKPSFEGCRDGQINVNTTTADLLEELVGIGSSKAGSIVEYRTQQLFYTVDDLLKVSGIGEATLTKIKDQNLACAAGVDNLAKPRNEDSEIVEVKEIQEAQHIYPKLLITEIQIADINSETEEFVELYNPGEKEIDLTNWYIQKKTQNASSFSSFASKNLFNGKKIAAKGYFLIAREGSTFVSQADILVSSSLAENNTIALKNPNGEIADKVGWGNAGDFEGSPSSNPSVLDSLSRKYENEYQDSDNNSVDFQAQTSTPKSINQVIQNNQLPKSQGNQAIMGDGEQTAVISDTTLPQISFNALASSQASVYFNLSWVVSDPVGDITPTGISEIYLEYSVSPSADGIFLNYETSTGALQNWQQGSSGKLTLSSLTEGVSLTAQDGVDYAFSLKAKDIAGNESAIATAQTAVNLAKTVVINEIAWMGTIGSSSDEWIELYNNTLSSVDLTGWELRSSDTSGPIVTLSGSISSQGFYLIERTDDAATTETANLTASFGNGLSNIACETLFLYNSGNVLIDQTACNTNTWPTGSASPSYISMERINAGTAGSNTSNWASNNLIKHNGRDVENNYINGTPKQINSVSATSTEVSLRFDEFDSLTLTRLGSPYYTNSSITVSSGKTLVIEPGVTLQLKGGYARLTVDGTLNAQGQSSNKIIFTNYDAPGASSSWCGIHFTSTSINSIIDHATIEKAASRTVPSCGSFNPRYAVFAETSTITLKNTIINQSDWQKKVYLKNSNSTIDTVTITEANNPGDPEATGILVEGGNPTIINSTFSSNTIGIWNKFPTGTPIITNNTFTNNTYPIKLTGSAGGTFSGNTATGNTYNGIFVESSMTSDVAWQATDLPYIVDSITVNAGKTLTVGAGVTVKFQYISSPGSGIIVNGKLLVQGTSNQQVLFTVNSSGASWRRIYFASTSTGSTLQNAIFEYGGNQTGEGIIYVQNSSLSVENIQIKNSLNSGMRINYSTVSGNGVTLTDNAYGFYILGTCPSLTGVVVQEGVTLNPSSDVCSF